MILSLKKFSEKRIKVQNIETKVSVNVSTKEIQIHIFLMQPRVLMVIVINPLVLEKICHGKVEDEKRVILVL